MDFFGIGPMELLLIIILGLIVFGPGKIPEVARQLGRTVREFKKASSSLTRDFKDEFEKELNSEPVQSKKNTGEKVTVETGPLGLPVNPVISETKHGNQN
jgi:TatA/E family protein of Tat protein translocase